VYDLFILNAWVVPFVCLSYGLIYKKIVNNKGDGSLVYLTPVFYIVISAVIFLTVSDIDRSSWSVMKEISDIIYDGLAAVGICELVVSLRKFVAIHLPRKKREKR